MPVLYSINAIFCLALSLLGVIFIVKRRKVFYRSIRISKIFFVSEITIFMGLFAVSGIVMTFIFFVNLHFGMVTIESYNFLHGIRVIPKEFFNVVIEELIMRVMVIAGFLLIYKQKHFALIGSSVIFSIAHSPTSFFTAFSYLLAGVMYAWLFYQFKTFWAPVGLHFGWNFFQGSIFGFPVSGEMLLSVIDVVIVDDFVLNGGTLGPEGSVIGVLMRVIIIFLLVLYSKSRWVVSLNSPNSKPQCLV